MTPRVAILDVGKTSLRVVAVDAAAREAAELRRASPSRPGPPYPCLDVDEAFDWICDALAELGREAPIEALVPVTHGAALALVDGEGLVLPVLDYEHDLPPLARTPADFLETRSPALPQGLNLATQLAYLEAEHAQAFARVRHALLLPQYFAWRLGGRPAAEVTSLGCHTHLWAPERGGFSRLALERGWDRLFPPLVPAWATVGTLDPCIARRAGLAPTCRVHAGIHDSNASYLVHRETRDEPFAVVSTGTWVVTMAHGADLARLDETRDMLANVDALGTPVACMRFPGGREYAARAAAEGPAAASRAGAQRIDACLEALGASGDVILEGPMARNETLAATLAALRAPAPVFASADPTGTTRGAALLARWDAPRARPALRRVAW